jgi:hypothetical protein
MDVYGASLRVRFPAFLLLLCLVLLGSPAAAAAAALDLPRTGETVCTDPDTGDPMACAGTGQDGEIRAGVPWPSPRFTVSGDCVTDALTGLVWPKDAGQAAGPVDWNAALAYADALELCGHTDWRLPSVNELASLVHAGQNGGASSRRRASSRSRTTAGRRPHWTTQSASSTGVISDLPRTTASTATPGVRSSRAAGGSVGGRRPARRRRYPWACGHRADGDIWPASLARTASRTTATAP